MDWDDLRFFLAVARGGTLTDSARRLKTSPSTVGRRLALLEQALGVTLFARHVSGYSLTDEGRALLARAETVEGEFQRLETEVAGLARGSFGDVRLATAESFATHLVIPRMPAFRARHPGVRLQVATSVRTIGLTRREADLALRLARPEQGNLVVCKLGTMAHGFYAAPAYLQGRPSVDAEDLAAHAVIGWDEEFAAMPVVRWLNDRLRGRRPVFDTTSIGQQVAAARAGLGLALLPCFVGDGEAGLLRVAGPAGLVEQDIWLVIHADVAASARVRAVADFLAETVRQERDRLAGRRLP
ncbi:LysR family transcriptional regulator [Azospirillum sp. sgz302134]